jgi:hypothetical protein
VPISSWYSPWSWYSSANVGEHVQLESESPGVKNLGMSVRIRGQSQLEQPRKLHPRFLEEEEGMRLSTLLLQVWKQIGVVVLDSRTLMVKTLGSGGSENGE